MKGNVLEAVVLLRIARDKLEEEARFVPTEPPRQNLNLISGAADDVSNVLAALEEEYGA